jgi:hypothetical protein
MYLQMYKKLRVFFGALRICGKEFCLRTWYAFRQAFCIGFSQPRKKQRRLSDDFGFA